MFHVIWYVAIGVFAIWALSAIIGVPFLPTHKKQARRAMQLANVRPGTKVVDLGSGAGRIVLMAARLGAKAVGYELNPFLTAWSKVVIWCAGLTGQAEVYLKSIYQADVSDADVVFAFLFPKLMPKVEEGIIPKMKPGALFVSYAFPLPNKKALYINQGLFVYRIGD